MNKIEKKFPVITLCGSTKFKKEFEDAANQLSLNNYIVLMPQIFAHALGLELTHAEKERFDKMHKQRIDMADAIMVINKDGYTGESTKEEIEYAKSKGKKIYYRYIYCDEDCKYYNNCILKAVFPSFVRCDNTDCPVCHHIRK